MPELPLLRFIPFRRSDVVALCRAGLAQDEAWAPQFDAAKEKIEYYFQSDFHRIKQQLKDAYAPLDPDADTRMLEGLHGEERPSSLVETLAGVLERANYEKVTDQALQRALNSSSLFQVRLFVDMNDFEEVLLYTRGASKRQETLRELFGLWRRKVRFTNYDRVLLYIRLKADVDSESTLSDCQPGSTILRLFQNVPEADLEMLFPNIRIGMRLLDKLMIGVPALVSGGLVMTTKMGATVLLLGSQINESAGPKPHLLKVQLQLKIKRSSTGPTLVSSSIKHTLPGLNQIHIERDTLISELCTFTIPITSKL